MVILGIDPGLATTGYGVIDTASSNPKMIAYGCILTDKREIFPERLVIIQRALEKLIKKYKPERAAVEELFFFKNLKTAIHVGHVRGVILLTLRQLGVPIFEITPLQVKQATTGYGKATKRQIQFMVKNLLQLSSVPKSDDAADALAIALAVTNHQIQ